MEHKHHAKHPGDRDLTKTPATQLSLLMGLDESQSLWSESDNAAMLRHLLDSPIPETQTPAQTFGRLLTSHHPDIDHLRRVKEFAKSCRKNPDSGLPQDLATVLYYASIAAAKLRCKLAISQLTAIELQDGIQWSLERTWLDDSLKQLFQSAARELPGRHQD